MNRMIHLEDRAGAVRGDIEFLRPTAKRPYSYGYEPADHEPAPTAVFERHSVLIHNARTVARRLSLDEHGATLIAHRSRVRDFYDDMQLIDVYYAEAAAVIKSATGASRVVVFDHNIRRGLSMALRSGSYDQGRPVLHAHTDYTEASAVRRLHDHFGAEAAELQRRRFMQVNLWRPIRGPLRDAPLAVCDASSITPRQLMPVDLVYPGRRGEIYYLAYDGAQRWYYAPDMEADEAWLLKNYDSAATRTSQVAAHSAFIDPAPYREVLPRESIEIRAFALFAI